MSLSDQVRFTGATRRSGFRAESTTVGFFDKQLCFNAIIFHSRARGALEAGNDESQRYFAGPAASRHILFSELHICPCDYRFVALRAFFLCDEELQIYFFRSGGAGRL